MTPELSTFAARLRERLHNAERGLWNAEHPAATEPAGVFSENEFNRLALELFALQFASNPPFRRVCQARQVAPETVKHWPEIPAVPTGAFKALALTCLPPAERTRVFHSSGTTGQGPGRHFHCAASLAIYESAAWPWFRAHLLPDCEVPIADGPSGGKLSFAAEPPPMANWQCAALTPPPAQAPRSSLVHMFDTVRRKLGATEAGFLGHTAEGGAWEVDFGQALACLEATAAAQTPLLLLGTAFSFVHLLDFLAERNRRFRLPAGSRVMETGGYKGRARALAPGELQALITDRLDIRPSHVVSEYGMSELSSQAYDGAVRNSEGGGRNEQRVFRFPPWARARVVSPETGREVAGGETGLLRVFDLANVWSVLAIQTEDLGVRRGDGFAFAGRVGAAEPRGCSLLAV